MKIGVIGTGNVGSALGNRFAALGHEVIFGSRQPESEDANSLNGKIVSPREAAQSAEAVLLAVPWPAKPAIDSLGDLTGKIVIDATNPLPPDLSGLVIGTTTSAAEQIAGWAPGAKVVKAFNTVGANIMANPKFADGAPVLFYCGDDGEAKKLVHQLAAKLGFDARDAGPLNQARLLEPFALLWISLAFTPGYGREIAFKFMRRDGV
jgi:hypothetical protein